MIVLGGLWLAISGAVLAAPGCYGRNCDGGVETFGDSPGEGRMISPDLWESSPTDGKWLWFPGQRTYIFDVKALGQRTPYLILPYLSAQEEPKSGNFTIGGGNLALLAGAGPDRINVINDSCSDYYLRLVLQVPPVPPTFDGGPTPAAPTENGTGDAGTEDDDDAGP